MKFSKDEPNTAPERLIGIDELAAFLGIKRSHVFELTRHRAKNPIPTVRLGSRTLRFKMSSVQKWVDAQEGVLTTKREYKLSIKAKKSKR